MTQLINVNIWDDYYEDGDVPEGKKQETYAYLENKLSDNDALKVLTLLKEKIDTLTSPNCSLKLEVVYHDSSKVYPNLIATEYEYCLYKRWQLNMTNLTHDMREWLVGKLQEEKMRYKEVELSVYSES